MRVIRILETQGSAAIAAKEPFPAGEDDGFRRAVRPSEAACFKERPCDEGRATGSPAILAMAEARLQGRPFRLIADGPAQAASGMDWIVHSGVVSEGWHAVKQRPGPPW